MVDQKKQLKKLAKEHETKRQQEEYENDIFVR